MADDMIQDVRDARRMGCGREDNKPDPGTHQCDFLAEFAVKNENITRQGDINSWARRFKRGEHFQFADKDNQRIMLNILNKDTLNDDVVAEFCGTGDY